MPTIQSLVKAQMQSTPSSESSDLSHDQLQQKLESMSRRLALFDATERVARIGHYEWSRVHGRLESCSAEYASLFNMTVEETLASHGSLEKTLLLIHPEDREHYMRATRAMDASKTLEVEFRILLEDGSIKHIRVSAVSVIDADGVDTGSFGLMQDITRQVRYERDLESRDELARQSEEITDIGHFIYDEDNECYLYLSEGCARIHGHSVDYFMENVKSFADDIGDIVDEDRERVADEYRYYRENGQNCAIEYRIRRPDGAIRWVRELGRPRAMNNGRVSETLGVMQDITDQVLREQELTFKDALANQAEAITEIGHFVYDEIRQKYLFASEGLLRIHGMQVEDLVQRIPVGVGGMDLVHPDDREKVEKVYARFLANGDEWQVDYRLLRVDGEVRWIREMGKVHLISHGIPEQTIGVLQDITAQKNAEQEIIKARDTLEQQVVERTRELANTVKQLQVEIEEREKIAAELHFLANHDALTGLPSLRLCMDRLDQSLA